MTSPGASDDPGAAVAALLGRMTDLAPSDLTSVVDLAGEILGASTARVLIADYGLTSLQELGENGPTGPRQALEGTMEGRAFSGRDVMVTGRDPAVVLVPLAEGSERLGVLEMTYATWDDEHEALLAPVVRVLVLLLISRRRYTDVVLEHLHAGDRVLFHTDGAVETRSASGELFGLPRLADLFLRASLEAVSPSETVRRLSTSIGAYNGRRPQ